MSAELHKCPKKAFPDPWTLSIHAQRAPESPVLPPTQAEELSPPSPGQLLPPCSHRAAAGRARHRKERIQGFIGLSPNRSNTNPASHSAPRSPAHPPVMLSHRRAEPGLLSVCLHPAGALASSHRVSHHYCLLPLPGLTGTGCNSKALPSFSCFAARGILQKCHPNGHHPAFSAPR